MSLSELLNVSAAPRARYGPAPSFAPPDVARALYEIGKRQPLGRADLTVRLGVGEGSVRTILSRLHAKGWLSTNRSGASLSDSGARLFAELSAALPVVVRVPSLDACFSRPSAAIVARGKAAACGSGIALRDVAIRAGADGATILARVKGVWRFPNDNARARKEDERVLQETGLGVVDVRDGDALVLSFAPTPALEWRGAWSVALGLLGKKP